MTADLDPVWVQMCNAAELDPSRRLTARQAVLDSSAALECTLYRPDDNDPDAEEEELGDARILFTGAFQAPEAWSEAERADFFGEEDPEQFVTADIECTESPASPRFFTVEPGDYVAVMENGVVVMYYLYDCQEDEQGLHGVLIRDEQELF
jgi:hypothetical protein